MIEAFVIRWGYPAVALGTFLEGETVLLAAGAMAHHGLLSFPLVLGAAFLGSLAGDQLWFQVGRRAGRSFIERRRRWKLASQRAERSLARGGRAFVLGFRFVYGFRTVTPVLLGATGYPAGRFFLLNAAGAAAWSALFGMFGWALGASLASILRRAARAEELLAAAAIVVLLCWLAGRSIRRARAARAGAPRREATA